MQYRNSRATGFTLIELLISMVVLAILITTAAPSFTRVMTGNKLSSIRDNLMSSIQFTKTEAISRNANVSICPSSNGTACTDNEDWSQGWIVYLDTDTGLDSTVGTVIRAVDGQTDINANNAGETGGLDPTVFLRFVPQGFSADAGPIGAQTIGFCDPNAAADGRSIVISATTGQVRPGTTAEAGC